MNTRITSSGHRALRRGRHSQPNQVYLVTTVTHERRPLFADLECARVLVRVLQQEDRMGYTHTWAFVVMPDHLHWLFALGEHGHLSAVMRRVKSVSGHRLAARLGVRRVWQASYHDHALRREEDLRALARYVVYNPVRAGLVAHPRDYPHWDARWL